MKNEQLDAILETSFEATETHISVFERLIAVYRAQHFHSEADRLELQVAELIQSLARRREAWDEFNDQAA